MEELEKQKTIMFMRYNEQNALMHLLAIEDHARYLDNVESPEHLSCINKHVLQAIEQASEGISHASSFAPDKVEAFTNIHTKMQELLNDLELSIPSKADLIRRIREVRLIAETLRPGFQISECKLCSFDHKSDVSGYRTRGVGSTATDIRLSKKAEEAYIKKGNEEPKPKKKNKLPGSATMLVVSVAITLGAMFLARGSKE